MVQKKVFSNKLGIHETIPNKSDKKQDLDSKKPSLQHHDGKNKGGADLKAIKMKKSRLIKRSDIEFQLRSSSELHDVPQKPCKPPPMATPTKTPSPKKLLHNKSPYSSPNYMKSTSSSEARKERASKASVLSTSKLHKVGRTLSKSSSLKKVRTLTKAPSFKHTRTTANKKVVFCENLDVQRSTCSSTLKDSKFPRYLTLAPGATEAQGTSVMKVCPYNYCSLNGHHHSPAPPLKHFLSSRRKLLKTQKAAKPEFASSSKRKCSEIKAEKDSPKVAVVFSDIPNMAGNENDEFFVEVYVPGREVTAGNDVVAREHDPAQFSEKFSSGPCSEIDFQDEDASLLYMNFCSENCGDEDFQATDAENQTLSESGDGGSDADVNSVSTVNFDHMFHESSDMEWEEGVMIPDFQNDKSELPFQKEYGSDQEPDFKLEKFVVEDFLLCFQDDSLEYILFSDDADSVSGIEFIQKDEEQTVEAVMDEGQYDWTSVLESDSVAELSKLEEELTEKSSNQNPNGEVSEPDSCKELDEKDGNESNGENFTEKDKEGNNADIVMEEQQLSESTIEDILSVTEVTENIGAGEGSSKVEANKHFRNSSSDSEGQNISDEVHLRSNESSAVESEELDMEDISKGEEDEEESPTSGNDSKQVKRINSHGANDSSEELLNHCSKFERTIRCKKEHEEDDEAREFNPRGPNFLPIQPDPEAEKVNLRHQEMDERKNSEEWMLDHALQKTVNQLAPARKKKVALLVAAFESVLPTTKYEPHMRRNASGVSTPRPIPVSG